ncbi:membrane hypothetical protein [Gammaproteobacteria bacterium]
MTGNLDYFMTTVFERILRVLVLSLLIITISGLVVFSLTPHGIATSPDSLYYLYAAKSLTRGQGVSVPNFDVASESTDSPMTAWPPLYPVALAAYLVNNSPERGARFFNWTALSILVLTFAWLLSQLGVPLLGVVIGSLLLFLQKSIAVIYAYAWSETLFLPLILISYSFGYQYRKHGQGRYLILATIFLIATCYTRYVGLIFLLPLIMMVWLPGQTQFRNLLKVLGVSSCVVLAMLPIFLRNLELMGSISGVVRARSEKTIVENLATVGDILGYHLFGWAMWYVPVVIVSILIWLIIFLYRRHSISNNKELTRHDILWPLLWAGCYLGGIVELGAWKEFDSLDTRLISPAILFIVLEVIVIAIWLRQLTGHVWVFLPFLLWGILSMMQGSIAYVAASQAQDAQYPSSSFANIQSRYLNLTVSSNIDWIKTVYKKLKLPPNDSVVISDFSRPMVLRYFINSQVRILPSRLDREVISRINRLGNGVLLIVTPEGMATLSNYYGEEEGRLQMIPEFLSYEAIVIRLPLALRPEDLN